MDQTFSQGIRWTPRLAKSITGRPVILGAVLFDGTRNDRLNVPDEERQTLVGHIYERLKDNNSVQFLRYYPGAGTQEQPIEALIDAAIGYTLKGVAERAADEVIATIDLLLQKTQDADVRLLVSGFSRGGAAARHFMNVLEQRWRAQRQTSPSLRFYALIFDTVATGQRERLSLQVPTLADLFYHFVSIDERRVLFKPMLDIQQSGLPGRIVTIPMPGAHSDVGAPYIGGVGSEYLANIDALLSSMGLLQQQCFNVDGDARAQGKNDSRWMTELLQGIGGPNTKETPPSRAAFYVLADPVPSDSWSDWNERMQAMEFNDDFSIPRCTRRHEIWMPEFMVTRNGENFEVVSLPPIYLPSSKILVEDSRHFLTYTFDGITLSKVEVPTAVLDRISEKHRAKLSLGVVEETYGEHYFWWFLDDIRVQKIDGKFFYKTDEF
ncbi:MAG: DUF2235 domain-containing protein [Propionivibrio sp.]